MELIIIFSTAVAAVLPVIFQPVCKSEEDVAEGLIKEREKEVELIRKEFKRWCKRRKHQEKALKGRKVYG